MHIFLNEVPISCYMYMLPNSSEIFSRNRKKFTQMFMIILRLAESLKTMNRSKIVYPGVVTSFGVLRHKWPLATIVASSTFAVRETASLGIMGALRCPP